MKVWIDGGGWNGRKSTYYVIVDLEDGSPNYHKFMETPREMTNNQAEYSALIEALELISREYPNENVKLYSDSQLLVNQLNDKWKIKNRVLLRYYNEAVDLIKRIKKIEFIWIPREENLAGIELEKRK